MCVEREPVSLFAEKNLGTLSPKVQSHKSEMNVEEERRTQLSRRATDKRIEQMRAVRKRARNAKLKGRQ